jgi:hypothetical protein
MRESRQLATTSSQHGLDHGYDAPAMRLRTILLAVLILGVSFARFCSRY